MTDLLITGCNGFVGNWLHSLLKDDYSILTFDDVDIGSADQVEQYLSGKKVDYVVHLAAQTFVPYSFERPLETFRVNFEGTYNLLNALHENNFSGRFLHVSSSDVYGTGMQDFPVLETHATRPLNPYSVSKCAAESLAYQWSQSGAFEIVIARPFNHIGPGQRPEFVVSDFARQCASIKANRQQPVINTGDIDVSRDFTDVRDVVHAYALLLEKGVNGEFYNVCSGKGTAIRDILTQLIDMTGENIALEVDSTRLRKTDVPETWGSSRKLFDATGWQPAISLKQSLTDIFDDWNSRV